MIESIEKKLCTGCYACYNICPPNCISMVEDSEGFVYPKVDKNTCTNCMMCVKTCPSLNGVHVEKNYSKPQIYAAWSLDEEVRYNSTSGGVFTELAKEIIQRNGHVVGARYNNNHTVEHFMIDKEEDISVLRQSKYIQSDVGFIYKDIKEILGIGKLVMFCGTPCEVAGLLNFLKKPYENLLICDFVCRGANSPKVYLRYLEMLQNKYNSLVKKVWFKNKTYGWNRFSTRIEFENGKEYIEDRYTDLFMRGYIEQNLYMRPCCAECKYKLFPRNSDITLADFWGVGTSNPKLDPDKGTSLVMINSPKGGKYFDSIKENIFAEENSLDIALSGNACILNSVTMNIKRKEFFYNIDEVPFDKLLKRYCKYSFKAKCKRKIYFILSKIKHGILGCKFH